MTPREVLVQHLGDDMADLALAALKDADLFIGPKAGTRRMFNSVRAHEPGRVKSLDYDDFQGIWAAARVEWQMNEGAS